MSNHLNFYYYNNHLTFHYNIKFKIIIHYVQMFGQECMQTAYAGVDHEGSLCSCCLDCLEDVHSSFNFDPLNFTHTSDEHTTARHAVTERGMNAIITHGLVEQM